MARACGVLDWQYWHTGYTIGMYIYCRNINDHVYVKDIGMLNVKNDEFMDVLSYADHCHLLFISNTFEGLPSTRYPCLHPVKSIAQFH